MVTTAAILGGSAIASGALSSSSGKKSGGGGESALDRILAETLEATTPIRGQVIERILNAFTGASPSETDSVTQQKKSAIVASGERQKKQLKNDLTRVGLERSSVGIAGIEDINRAIAQLLATANTAELERLTSLGESLSFGQPIDSAGRAASSLAGIEAANAGRAAGTAGTSIGQALALLYQGGLGRSTAPVIGAPNAFSPSGFNPTVAGNTGQGLELLLN